MPVWPGQVGITSPSIQPTVNNPQLPGTVIGFPSVDLTNNWTIVGTSTSLSSAVGGDEFLVSGGSSDTEYVYASSSGSVGAMTLAMLRGAPVLPHVGYIMFCLQGQTTTVGETAIISIGIQKGSDVRILNQVNVTYQTGYPSSYPTYWVRIDANPFGGLMPRLAVDQTIIDNDGQVWSFWFRLENNLSGTVRIQFVFAYIQTVDVPLYVPGEPLNDKAQPTDSFSGILIQSFSDTSLPTDSVLVIYLQFLNDQAKPTDVQSKHINYRNAVRTGGLDPRRATRGGPPRET